MKKYLILLSFLFVFLSSFSQNFDNIFDDGGANAQNTIYLSSIDFMRGVPAIAYKRVLLSTPSFDQTIFTKIGFGVQMMDPLAKLPYYSNSFNDDLFYDKWIFDQPVYKIEPDSFAKAKFINLAFGATLSDGLFNTNNHFEMSLVVYHESFMHKNNKLFTNSLMLNLGYELNINNKANILFEIGGGPGFLKYINEQDIFPAYKLNIELGYSF